jgi:NADH dehydrogenase (ubiquinone) Fe-S protein 3
MKSLFNLKYLNSLKQEVPLKEIALTNNEISLVVGPKTLALTLQFLKDHNSCQYKSLSSVSGTDYPQKQDRFEIAYDLLSLRFNGRIRLKTQVDEITPLESATSLFRCADWWEREL